MILLKNQDYTISQPIDYRSNTFVASNQNSINMMIKHRTKTICSVDNTKSLEIKVSSKKLSAIFIELSSQHALVVAHIVINMNLNRK